MYVFLLSCFVTMSIVKSATQIELYYIVWEYMR